MGQWNLQEWVVLDPMLKIYKLSGLKKLTLNINSQNVHVPTRVPGLAEAEPVGGRPFSNNSLDWRKIKKFGFKILV
jgi:hypothetical protein